MRKPRENHGLSRHPLYRKWQDMLARCYVPSAVPYQWYGAKGVTVCREWRDSFKAFYDWSITNGWRPEYDLDKDTKVSGNKKYSPEACCYIPHRENMIAIVGRQSGRRTQRLKLNAKQVSDIVERKKAGNPTNLLASEYGISVGYVNALFRQAKTT
jgi:hypothetical protein